MSLAQARDRRDAARRDIASGIDPSLRRVCERLCVSIAFELVAREFIGILRVANISPESPSRAAADLLEKTRTPFRLPRLREPISADTLDTMERRLELHVFPYIGEQDVRLLTALEMLEVLRRIESRSGAGVTAASLTSRAPRASLPTI